MTRFGYFLSGEELSPTEIVRFAQEAERAGFERVWVSDHYHPWIEEQGESPFIWGVLGAIAATTHLEMTTAVTCPTVRIHPAVLAQATATTAALAPGRFRFGVGTGEALNEHILGAAWPPYEVRSEMLAEAIEIIRRLWTGESVTHRGQHYTVHNARLFSRPDEPPPVLVSGFGPKSAELAARIGDGYVNVRPDKDLVATYEKAGGTGVKQAGVKMCWAATDAEAAETAYRFWGFEGMGGQSSQDLPHWSEFAAMAENGSPERMAEKIPCGPDAKRAADAISAYIDAGFDEVYISQMGPDQAGGIRFLTDEVLPLVA